MSFLKPACLYSSADFFFLFFFSLREWTLVNCFFTTVHCHFHSESWMCHIILLNLARLSSFFPLKQLFWTLISPNLGTLESAALSCSSEITRPHLESCYMAEFYLKSESAFPHHAGLFCLNPGPPFLSSPLLEIWHYSNSHIDVSSSSSSSLSLGPFVFHHLSRLESCSLWVTQGGWMSTQGVVGEGAQWRLRLPVEK